MPCDAELIFADALALHAQGRIAPPELCAIYVAERARRAAGSRFRQAPRRPPLATASRSPVIRLFAERELHKLPGAVARALVAWDRLEADAARAGASTGALGARDRLEADVLPTAARAPLVELRFDVPSARRVLSLQARGRRVVSLLPDGADAAPHADGLAFAVHDLCHLEKLLAPEHHAAQVGFFAALDAAVADPRWAELEAGLDAAWRAGRDYVMADMNGSAAFLFVTLRSHLKLAVRRRVAAERGAPPPPGGPLDAGEASAFEVALEQLLDLLALDGDARTAARALASKRDDERLAHVLVERWRHAGEARLAGELPRAFVQPGSNAAHELELEPSARPSLGEQTPTRVVASASSC